jgi:5-methylthioadenosine/S-adenosylhomocysteine deaminase
MELLLSGGHVLHRGRIVRADVLVADGTVGAVGTGLSQDAELFDATGTVIIPGLRNTHMHAATSLIQGMPVSAPLDGWVSDLWRFEQGITPKEAFWGALYSCWRMLLTGITYFEDMHFHECEVARACEQSGIRAALSEALMDTQPWESPATPDSSLRLARQTRDCPTIEAKMGLVSIRMASEDLIDRAIEVFAAHRDFFSGFHLHIDEVPEDRTASLRAYGMSPTSVFYEKGVLAPGTTVAHYVHPTLRDMRVMAASGAAVSHCHGSNLRLGSGQAPLSALLRLGIPVSLGIDSPSIHDGYDLWGDARAQALALGLEVGDALALLCGSAGIEAGMPADFALLKREWFFPYRNMVQALVYGMTPAAVKHVFVNGKCVVSGGIATAIDAEKLSERAIGAATSVWSRLECGK